MYVLTIRVPSVEGPGWSSISRVVVPEGFVVRTSFPSSWLISPGQPIDVDVSIEAVSDPKPGGVVQDGRKMPAAREIAYRVPVSWDSMPIPSTRTLSQIIEEAVRHGYDNPSHGVDCSCMDKYAQEIKQQISRAIPPDTGSTTDIHWKIDARHRVATILRMVTRWL